MLRQENTRNVVADFRRLGPRRGGIGQAVEAEIVSVKGKSNEKMRRRIDPGGADGKENFSR